MSQLPQRKVRPVTPADLKMVLGWRNHPSIRRYMYTQHEISLDEHCNWFEQASKDAQRHLLIFEIDSEPSGFINVHQIAIGGIADWGFYAKPDAPKGTGQKMGRAALEYAFGQCSLHKLCGQAIAYNEPSIKFHRRLGFHQEGVLREQHFDGQEYHDVICFGLLASEWVASH